MVIGMRLAHRLLIEIWYGIVAVFKRIPGFEATCEGLGALAEDMSEWLLDVVFPFVLVLAVVAGAVFGIGFVVHAGWAALP